MRRLRLSLVADNGDRGRLCLIPERFARDALFIDVMNDDARNLLLEALKAQKKDAEAERIAKRFE